MPPGRILQAAQDVVSARILAHRPPFIPQTRATGAKARGVSYERKVLDKLEILAMARGLEYYRSPWFEFHDSTGRRWCQPDAILLSEDTAIIAEVKYQHTADAWFQLWEIYRPVVGTAFPGRTLRCVEIVKWYDPNTYFPQAVDLTDDPLKIPHENRTAVHIWNPQRD